MFDIQGTHNSERLVGTAASESIYSGDDFLYAGSDADSMAGDAGNDTLQGDALGSLQVRLTDVLQMLKYYLGKSTDNNLKPQWAFMDVTDLGLSASSTMALGANGQALSKLNATPHPIDIDVSTGIDSVQLVGVLRGDVDGSWTAPVN